MPSDDKTTDELGALRPWSDAAALLLRRDPAKWAGFEFSGEAGVGMYVTGRIGKFGKAKEVFVPLSSLPQETKE